MGPPFPPGPTGNLAQIGDLWGNLPCFGTEPGHGNHINVDGPWKDAHPAVPPLVWPAQAAMPALPLNPVLAPAVTGQVALPEPQMPAPPPPPQTAPGPAGGAAWPSRRAPPVAQHPLPTPSSSANTGVGVPQVLVLAHLLENLGVALYTLGPPQCQRCAQLNLVCDPCLDQMCHLGRPRNRALQLALLALGSLGVGLQRNPAELPAP